MAAPPIPIDAGESADRRVIPFPAEAAQRPDPRERLLIVLPCLNEGPRIGGLLDDLARLHPEADLVVVDDGSEDDTAEQARRRGVAVLALPYNLGYGAALQAGYKYALEKDYSLVVQMDGDGQHPPEEVARLLRAHRRGGLDVVIGSRFLGRPCYPVPRARRLGIRLFAALTSWMVGRRVTDPTSGFQVLHREVLRLYRRDFYPYDYPDADILVRLHRSGFRFGEVGVEMRAGVPGKSMHRGLRPIWYGYKLLLSTFLSWISAGEARRR